MSITSLSVTFVNMYAPQSARPVAAPERQMHCAPAAPADQDAARPGGRQNRLVEAMMTALRELGLAAPASEGPASAPAAASPAVLPSASVTSAQTAAEAVAAGAAAATAADPATTNNAAVADDAAATSAVQAPVQEPVSVESAVYQFAHELFSALRQLGRGESSGQWPGRGDGDGGRRQHHGAHGSHGAHGWRHHGYGNMAQRLDALSQTFAAQAPAAPASATASPEGEAAAAAASSMTITVSLQEGQPGAPAQALTTAGAEPVATAAQAEPSASVATAETSIVTAASSTQNPLLEAFTQLMGALKPQGAGASASDMAATLRTFLQTLSQALRPESMSTIQTPQVGGLVNVTA